MYIWAENVAQDFMAGTYYRLKTPLEQMHKMYDVRSYEDRRQDNETGMHIQTSADFNLFYLMNNETTLYQINVLKDIKPNEVDGKMIYPPTCIYDTDDNSDYVHPFNNTFVVEGLRNYPNGELLVPGQDPLVFKDAQGEEHVMWEDGVTTAGTNHGLRTFSIADNLQRMKVRHEVQRAVHGITTTVKPLADYFKKVVGQPNVYVFPNTVVPEDYEQYHVIRKNPNEIRILWQGSQSHYIDWFPLREALKTISEKYTNVKWIMFGEIMPWVHDVIPEDRREYHRWVHYHAYKMKRGLFDIDINLCPLVDNPFNRCKSPIKWYEASIWDRPEATLASQTVVYNEIEEGKTGLLYKTPEEFVQKLSILIENAELRKTLGANARKWVLDNRTPEKTIPGLYEFYNETRERHCYDLCGRKIVIASK